MISDVRPWREEQQADGYCARDSGVHGTPDVCAGRRVASEAGAKRAPVARPPFLAPIARLAAELSRAGDTTARSRQTLRIVATRPDR
jgi:hypothetical protein